MGNFACRVKNALRHSWKVVPPFARRPLTNLFVGGLPHSDGFRLGVPTVAGLLQNAGQNGFAPQTIIDVGANIGDWSRMAHGVFPSAQVLLIDGNPENEPSLRKAAAQIGRDSAYSISLLGRQEIPGVTFHVVGTGSSVLPELAPFDSSQISQITLPMRTLDDVVGGRRVHGPVLLKLDVQGFELEVLRGGSAILTLADMVIVETSLIPYNENAPLFAEVVAFMASRDFLVFDFCGHARRQTDNVLFQTDVAFVKKDSVLRSPKDFWLGKANRTRRTQSPVAVGTHAQDHADSAFRESK